MSPSAALLGHCPACGAPAQNTPACPWCGREYPLPPAPPPAPVPPQAAQGIWLDDLAEHAQPISRPPEVISPVREPFSPPPASARPSGPAPLRQRSPAKAFGAGCATMIIVLLSCGLLSWFITNQLQVNFPLIILLFMSLIFAGVAAFLAGAAAFFRG